MNIMSMTAVEIGKKIRSKEISVAEAVKASLSQIEKAEEKIHSFVTVDREAPSNVRKRSRSSWRKAALQALWREYRWRSRIIFVPRICLLPAVLRFWKTLSPHIQQRQSGIWKRRGQ